MQNSQILNTVFLRFKKNINKNSILKETRLAGHNITRHLCETQYAVTYRTQKKKNIYIYQILYTGKKKCRLGS